MKKIMTVDDRKKWILDHKSDYLEYGKESADKWYNRIVKVWEDGTSLKYSPEEFDKWNSLEGEDKKVKTIEERYQERLKKRATIEHYLNVDESPGLLKDEQFFNKEVVDGIDVSKELDAIRYNHTNEVSIYLFIKDNVIVDKYFVNGKRTTVNLATNMEILNIVNNAHRLEASVYHVHNHPNNFSAIPSEGDKKANDTLAKALNIFGSELLDWGVVTEWDYYSYKQNEKEG